MAAKRPVLSVCFGAQLLFALLAELEHGESLAESPSQEHIAKLIAVDVRGKGEEDPVVGHLADGTGVPHWHEDSFGSHPKITPLAWSKESSLEHCEAFRVGEPEDAVYGLQFHPEPTLEMLLKQDEKERWFEVIPDEHVLERTVAAGEKALRAWLKLARAR